MKLPVRGNSCKRPGPGQHSWLAQRVPKVVRSGNEEKNAELERDRCCLMEVIDSCLEDAGNITVAYQAIQRRKHSLVTGIRTDDAKANFDKISQVDRLDTNWMMQFISQNTDLDMRDLLKVYSYEATGILEIFTFMTELPWALRLPKQCMVKWVMYEMTKDRWSAVGQRGQALKRNGVVKADGSLNWKDWGSYTITFQDDVAKQVIHKPSGLQKALPDGVVITRAFTLQNNFSDHQAVLVCDPIPPIRLDKFFELTAEGLAATGPFSYKVYGGGHCKAYNELAVTKYKVWQVEEDKKDLGAEADEVLQIAKTAQAKARCAKARVAAKATAQRKKQRRTITL